MPWGASLRATFISASSRSTSASSGSSSSRSLAHQSSQYPAGTRFLLFSMNSPYPRTSSPLSHTEPTFDRTKAKLCASSNLRNRPSLSTTHGPSVWSEGVIAQALPGRSIFICVPMVMKSSIASIEAVFVEAAARPEGRARP